MTHNILDSLTGRNLSSDVSVEQTNVEFETSFACAFREILSGAWVLTQLQVWAEPDDSAALKATMDWHQI